MQQQEGQEQEQGEGAGGRRQWQGPGEGGRRQEQDHDFPSCPAILTDCRKDEEPVNTGYQMKRTKEGSFLKRHSSQKDGGKDDILAKPRQL